MELGNLVKRIVLLLGLAPFLFGCAAKPFLVADSGKYAATGTSFENQATAYVMRDSSYAFIAWPINVLLDGEEVGSLRRETYTRFAVSPGRHVITAHWNPISGLPDVALDIQFDAGRTYYFGFGTNFGIGYNTMTYSANLNPMNPELGARAVGRYEDWTPGTEE